MNCEGFHSYFRLAGRKGPAASGKDGTGMEKVYAFKRTSEKLMEKIVDDERVAINHIVLGPGDSVPTHVSNSFVHQIVVRGTLSLGLEGRFFHEYPAGSIIAVPFDRKMAIENRGLETLEFFVIKAPNPREMPAVKKI